MQDEEEAGVMTVMAPPKKRKAQVGRPKAEEPKRSLASLKGTESYAEWFNGLADFARLPAAILIEHALREWADKHGYGKDQPKR